MLKKLIRKITRKLEGKLDPNNVSYKIARRWYEDRRGGYEKLVSAVIPFVPKKGVVFDVGANIGFFSQVLFDKIGFEGTAHLFEPVPNLAKICLEGFTASPYRVKMYPYGLGDKDEILKIHTAKNGNLGWNTFVSGKASPDMNVVDVRVKVFDKGGIEAKPAFIKIDVEGSEYKVLAGMMKSLGAWKPKPVILCEIGWGQGHPDWAQQLKVFKKLLKIGYQAYRLDGRRFDFDKDVLTETVDLLFLPKGKKFLKAAV